MPRPEYGPWTWMMAAEGQGRCRRGGSPQAQQRQQHDKSLTRQHQPRDRAGLPVVGAEGGQVERPEAKAISMPGCPAAGS